MDYQDFIARNRDSWRRLETLLRENGRRRFRRARPEQIREFGRLHRRVNRDLAYADSFFPGTRAAGYLAGLAARAHRLIYRGRGRRGREVLGLFTRAPDAFRRNLRVFALAAGLFALWTFIGYVLTLQDPAVAGFFLSPKLRETVREGEIWTEGLLSVFPGTFLSAGLFVNNFNVALVTFASGLTVLGPAYLVSQNGLMLGSILAYCTPYGVAPRLLRFILAHGPPEILGLVLAATAGLILARAILSPGLAARGESLRRAARDAASLFAVAAGALVCAALLEGFVSTDDAMPVWARALAGTTAAGAALFLLTRRGLHRPSAKDGPAEGAPAGP